MIRITNLKLPADHRMEELTAHAAKAMRIAPGEIQRLTIIKQSLDARKKPDLFYIYTVDVSVSGREEQILRRDKKGILSRSFPWQYAYPVPGAEQLCSRPVVIGSGPAGLFAAWMLARSGYAPLLLERGEPVEKRQRTVEEFWRTGKLNPSSNVQFGEGGAGTFSDGKLNTRVKDSAGRMRLVQEILIQAGAPEDIRYVNHPHLGTDLLRDIVRHIRMEIIRLGGEVRFSACVTDLDIRSGRLAGLILNGNEYLQTETAVLAVGHSARDTFSLLEEKQLSMEAKAFAVGFRIQHPQQMIQDAQYGRDCKYALPAAPYKVTAKLPDGRGVYSFCMCPGGYVVNASSEEGMLAVNGMSYHDRGGKNANSAIVVTVSPGDYGGTGPLAGVEFQRRMERAAYQAGNGAVPVQTFADFCQNRPSEAFGGVQPEIKGSWTPANLRPILTEELNQAIEQGIHRFDRMIPGFARGDALLAGVESRTSSPVRILRNDQLESNISGIFPCGEGAGYAGGITSAAMDGIRVAEAIIRRFSPFREG